jgi:PPOX class probable F420-dependent enzyme
LEDVVQIDTSSEFGARVANRLRDEHLIWLTTVGANLAPNPAPVWFLWDGESFLIYSQPRKPKLRHLERHPRVALHFDGNGRGGNIVVLIGQARLDPTAPPADAVPEYVEKYREFIPRIGMTPEQFARAYSVAIRVTPTRLRGH